MLCAPLVKNLMIYETYLTKNEVSRLVALVRKRRIMQNAVSLKWRNYNLNRPSDPWIADEDEFQLLLNTLLVTIPKLKITDSKISQKILF